MIKNFDIYKFLQKRPLSWSAISAWEYNKDEWYERYIVNKKPKSNPEMTFGKRLADSIEAGKPLAPVTMLSKVEQEFTVMFGRIKLTGWLDTFDHLTKKKIGEFKTGVKAWDQKRVDNHGQITMYCFLNYVTNRIRPEETELFLEWIPTIRIHRENGDFSGDDYTIEFAKPVQVIPFTTKRTMQDILKFGERINQIVKGMEEYVNKLSTSGRFDAVHAKD